MKIIKLFSKSMLRSAIYQKYFFSFFAILLGRVVVPFYKIAVNLPRTNPVKENHIGSVVSDIICFGEQADTQNNLPYHEEGL